MRILFFGDIVGRPGREALARIVTKWRKQYSPDFIIANGENLAHGKGVTKKTFNEVLSYGIDLLTSGNHIWCQKEVKEIFQENKPLIRPANYPEGVPGVGYKLLKKESKEILILNLIGRVFMRENYDDPFRKADKILEDYTLPFANRDDKKIVDAIIVDCHTEATSEKRALGWYLDGRVSAVIGTHTHVPTADAVILPQKTAYISDVGMVGARDSILGLDVETVLKGFLTQMPQKFILASENSSVIASSVLIDVDRSTGLAKNIELLQESVVL